MLRSCELRQKEVVNIRTAERLGYVEDIDIDTGTGYIKNIVVPKHKFFLLKREDLIIPWECIVLVGSEIILVNYGSEILIN